MKPAIRINTNDLIIKIEELKFVKRKIDDTLGNFKDNASKIDSYWQGRTGERAKEEAVEYSNQFEYISKKLENYIVFLEKVSQAYENEDNEISKKIDANVKLSVSR